LENDGFGEEETSTYEKMREYVEQLIKHMKKETQREEVAGGSTSELDRKNKKRRKMKRKIKEIEVLERYIKIENEMLRTLLTSENDRSSIKRVEPVRGCLITQAVWYGPP
jgi:hypothetical protein